MSLIVGFAQPNDFVFHSEFNHVSSPPMKRCSCWYFSFCSFIVPVHEIVVGAKIIGIVYCELPRFLILSKSMSYPLLSFVPNIFFVYASLYFH